MPNNIIENNLLFGFKSIKNNQLEAKINNFFILINDNKILKQLIDIRLLEIQNRLMLETNPLYNLPYTQEEINNMDKKLKNNYIIDCIILC